MADTADGFVRALRTSSARGEVIIDLGGGMPTTIPDLAARVHEAPPAP